MAPRIVNVGNRCFQLDGDPRYVLHGDTQPIHRPDGSLAGLAYLTTDNERILAVYDPEGVRFLADPEEYAQTMDNPQ